MSIYFDNAATTKVDQKVIDTMAPFFDEKFANPHAVYSLGQDALVAVEESREKIAKLMNCDSQELYFTSGATESNNIIIQGIVNYFKKDKIHIITSAIEHPSVLEVFKNYQSDDNVEVSFCPVDEFGVIKIEKLKELIKENTVLISVIYANNEVGTVQPIEEIAHLKKDVLQNRSGNLPLYLHTDAVQAFNYIKIDIRKLGVDALSFSGHKIHAPKGVGGLVMTKAVKFKPLVFGGHQERGVRSGTLNVPSIVGLGQAVEIVFNEQKKNFKKIKEIKDELVKGLLEIENIKFNGDYKNNQLPNIINVSFLKAEGESILMLLDMDGVAISTGSACSSGSLEPSHVLKAMGNKSEWSHGSIRISLSKFNEKSEAKDFIKKIKPIIAKLREMAP